MQNIHTCKYRKSISSGKINLCATKLSVSQTEDNERASLMGHPLVVVFFQPDGSNQPSSPSPPPGVGVVPPLPVPEPEPVPVAGFAPKAQPPKKPAQPKPAVADKPAEGAAPAAPKDEK